MFTEEKRNVIKNYEIVKLLNEFSDDDMAVALGWGSRSTKSQRRKKGNWTMEELIILRNLSKKSGRDITVDDLIRKVM